MSSNQLSPQTYRNIERQLRSLLHVNKGEFLMCGELNTEKELIDGKAYSLIIAYRIIDKGKIISSRVWLGSITKTSDTARVQLSKIKNGKMEKKESYKIRM